MLNQHSAIRNQHFQHSSHRFPESNASTVIHVADEFPLDRCDIGQPAPEFEPALFQQANARVVSLEKNAEQHVLSQSRGSIDGVLDERGPDAATAVGRSNVVGDFRGSSERGATWPVRTERAPAENCSFALGDVDWQACRIVIVEPRRSLADGDRFEVGGCETLFDSFVVYRDDRRQIIEGCGSNRHHGKQDPYRVCAPSHSHASACISRLN